MLRLLWRLKRNVNCLQKNVTTNYCISELLTTRQMCISKKHEDELKSRKTTESDISSDLSIETSYSSEQQSNILRVLNESTFEELGQYALSKVQSNKIISYRNKHGSFKNIYNLLEVDGFGSISIELLCDTVAYGTGGVQKRYLAANKKSTFQPEVLDELRKTLESVVAIRVHYSQALWIHLTRDMRILDWSIITLENISSSNSSPVNYELAYKLSKILPEADAYVMEQRPFKVRQMSQVKALCTLLQIESMLMALLNRDVHRVFVVKNENVASLFHLRLGNERISSSRVVEDLISGSHTSSLRRVVAEDETILDYYRNQKYVDREELGNCLLQAVAFYELEIVRT